MDKRSPDALIYPMDAKKRKYIVLDFNKPILIGFGINILL